MKLNISDLSVRPPYNPLISLIMFIVWPIILTVIVVAVVVFGTIAWVLIPFGRMYREGNKWNYKL